MNTHRYITRSQVVPLRIIEMQQVGIICDRVTKELLIQKLWKHTYFFFYVLPAISPNGSKFHMGYVHIRVTLVSVLDHPWWQRRQQSVGSSSRRAPGGLSGSVPDTRRPPGSPSSSQLPAHSTGLDSNSEVLKAELYNPRCFHSLSLCHFYIKKNHLVQVSEYFRRQSWNFRNQWRSKRMSWAWINPPSPDHMESPSGKPSVCRSNHGASGEQTPN